MMKQCKPAAILIELLLFIAFVGATAGFILSIIIYVSIQDANAEITGMIENTGTKIITSLTQRVRQGEQIVLPTPGNSDTTLQVTMFEDDEHPTTFTESENTLYFGTVNNLEPLFSTAAVLVSNTFIENISNDNSESVRISFTLSSSAGTKGIGYSKDFSTVVHLYEDSVVNQDCSCAAISCNGSFYEWGYCDPGLTTCNTFVSDLSCTLVAGLVSVTTTTNAAEPSTHGVFTISLNSTNTTGSPITVGYSIDGTAAENNNDYNTLASTSFIPSGLAGVEAGVDIPNGQSSVTIPITVVDDVIEEGTETITIYLDAVSGTGYIIDTDNNTALLSITDDDASIASSSSSSSSISGTTSTSCNMSTHTYPCTGNGLWYETQPDCTAGCGSPCTVQPLCAPAT